MRPRALVLTIAAVCATFGGWAAMRTDAPAAPDAAAPVVVGSVRVAAAGLEAAAQRAAGSHPSRLASARRFAADRAIERLWLEGEASERGLRPARRLRDLRGQVADALAGPGPLPRAARLGAAFDAFHERWRARTRCLAAYRDPYEDRCGDDAADGERDRAAAACHSTGEDRCGDAAAADGAAAGSGAAAVASCRWMGEATLCDVGRRWLVARARRSAAGARAAAARLPRRLASRLRSARGSVVRLRSRAAAVATARALSAVARAARLRVQARARAAARKAAAARERAAAAKKRAADAADQARERAAGAARLARDRQERLRDPRLSPPAMTAAREACARQMDESDPYLFGFGLQDVVGQAEGLIAARTALARGVVGAAPDPIDRRKLRPLTDAIHAGNRALARIGAADAVGDAAAVAARVARFDARTEPERAISRRLGLGDCLARPARPGSGRPPSAPRSP